ncbi:restriction endonuclease subunit S [uncultured Ruminococcus sp.]|uniref:restriction endonuclease subunit S n=1 Tax=uncultured Ruminococcus sp. TaxID=165186 RepID=UPI0025D95220|nr:restriction endonuclease subunit S [uncultured Ruminococcus sp.]
MSKWDTVRLGDVVTLLNGRAYKQNELLNTGKYPVLRVGNFFSNRDWYYSDLELEEDKYCDNGDLLFAWSASFGPKIWDGEKVIYHYHIWKILTTDRIRKDFLYYYLDNVAERVKAEGHGITMIHTTKAEMEERIIPIPPLETQCKIAANLDKVTHTIDLCNAILEKLDLLVKSRFVEMFGDIYTNKHSFPIQQLADYIDFLTSGSRGWAKYCVDDGSEWFITIKNVKDCRISTDNIQPVNAPDNMEAKRTKVEEGDLLISITADLGRTGVVTREIAEHGAYINQHLTCIRLDKTKLIPLYVAYFMESESGTPQFEAKNQTGVKAGLNFDSIKSLKLLVPPLALQQQFAAFVEQTDKSKLAVKQVLEKAETLKKALMQEYFG